MRDSAADELPVVKDLAAFVPTIMHLSYNCS